MFLFFEELFNQKFSINNVSWFMKLSDKYKFK